MFPLFRRDAPGIGFVYFASDAPPPAEAFGFLRNAGVEIVSLRPEAGALWALELAHPEFGKARVQLSRDVPPAAHFLQFGYGLLPTEAALAEYATTAVTVAVSADRKNVLRDRKLMLRFMSLLMAEDAVLAVDVASGRPWSRAALADELSHDADLDVEALFVFHAVGEAGRVDWLHSHGLAELGGFDFDVLRPGAPVVANANDVLRALAFAMIAGKIDCSTGRYELVVPGGEVSLVPADEFMRRASPEDRGVRAPSDPSHDADRVVVCDPVRRSLLRRPARPVPARLLAAGASDDMMLAFDTASTELMAERARGTLPVLRSLLDEFDDLPVRPLVKLGFTRAHAETGEFLWFEVHELDGDSVNATLLNEPFDVPALREGQRGRHELERLCDWTLLTPMGAVTPRSGLAGRRLRSLPEEVRRRLASAGRERDAVAAGA